MGTNPISGQMLLAENAELRARLEEAEEALRAIRAGEVDALVVDSATGPRIFTLQGLEAESNRFRGELLAQVGDAVIVLDEDRRLIYLNAAAQRQYGVAAAEVAGLPVTHIFEPQWLRPQDEAAATAALRDAGQWRGELRHVLRSGVAIHVEASLTRLQESTGTGPGLLAVIRDITQEHGLRVLAQQRQELVRQSEVRLKRVLDQLFVFVAVLDLDGRLLECNGVPLQRAGLQPSDVIGRLFWECHWWLHDSSVARQLRDGVWRAVQGETVRFDACTAFGAELVTCDFQLAALRDDAGRITNVIASGVDVEARVQAHAALRRADRQKDEFLATLAHELRNPLAPIRTAVELIRRREPADATVQRARVIIERQVLHLSRLVDDLLDVSRITLGTIQLRQETLDLGAVAVSAVDSIGAMLDAAGLTLEPQMPARPVHVRGDATRLAQCILNVLNNAAKFTPRGGRITLRVAQQGDLAVVEVTDTGSGIASANLERIFDLFTQEQPSGHGGNTGLGIGLALTRKLVKLHGGAVRAESAGPGRGSTFRVELPAVADAAAADDVSRPGWAADGADARVLVVDDNRDAADALGEMLAMCGFVVDKVYNGEAAVSAVAQDTPDAVLLDIGLPDIDGYEVCRRIRSSGVPRQPVVIALTGWAQDKDRDAASAAGFNGHLTKPAAPDRLIALLQELVAARR